MTNHVYSPLLTGYSADDVVTSAHMCLRWLRVKIRLINEAGVCVGEARSALIGFRRG